MVIKLDIWYSTPARYGIATYKSGERTLLGSRSDIAAQLSAYADNVNAIRIDKTVNSIAVNTTNRYIFQVSGYSARRGMYCDVL